jgi:putative ABC transport system permease protein
MKGDLNSTGIVNETAVRKYQLGKVIGKFATRLGNGSNVTVIGIVKDFHYQSLHHTINPVLFYFDKGRYSYVNLKISSKNIKATISKIEHLWYSMCPTYPFEYHFLDDAFDEQYKSDDRFGSLVGYASILAIVIACLGILGLAAFSTEQRTKEIGVRKVNGATTLEISILLSKDFTKWVFIAFIVASPIAWYAMNKWLENFAYKTNIAWWIFLSAGFITYLIALLTIGWLSFKAATRNPVESLRYE